MRVSHCRLLLGREHTRAIQIILRESHQERKRGKDLMTQTTGKAQCKKGDTEPPEEIPGSPPQPPSGILLRQNARQMASVFRGRRRADGAQGRPEWRPPGPTLGAYQSRRRFIRSDKTELRQRGCGGRERVAKLCYTFPYSQSVYRIQYTVRNCNHHLHVSTRCVR